MPLTPQQKDFLDKYVHKRRNFLTKKGKEKRSNGFAMMRDKLQSALLKAPSGLPELPQLIRGVRQADTLAEKLKFNRASDAIEELLIVLGKAIENYRPPQDPNDSKDVPAEQVERLLGRLNDTLNDPDFQDPQVQLLAKELGFAIDRAHHLLGQGTVNQKDFNQAERLVEEVEGKIGVLLQHRDRIQERKTKLEKYLALAKKREETLPSDGFADLQKQVEDLLLVQEWSSIEESTGMALYLKLTLALAAGTQTQQKDFKKGRSEMVLAVRRKESSSNEPNFKVLVKPARLEIAVNGFKKGGGATREAMGSFLGDELQRQMGFNLRVPETRVVTIDGKDLMGDSVEKEEGDNSGKKFTETEKVVTSVQTFEDGCKTIGERASTLLTREEIAEKGNGHALDRLQIPKRDIQQMAVFDLIALHCDRHEGNMMVNEAGKLVPIDHGNIMPTKTGLRQRKTNLSAKSSVIGQSAAAKEMLVPELLESIERLDIDQLIASMKDQHDQMKLENDGIDVDDLNDGLANVRRSSEFLKFAAKELTLEQIYDAFGELQDLIFFSEEDDKITSFRTAVDTMKNREQSLTMLEVFLGVTPETPKRAIELRKRVFERLKALGWFLYGSDGKGSVNESFQLALPARCLEIISSGLKSGLPESEKERYKELGGRRAAIRLGFISESEDVKMSSDSKYSKTRINNLELHYAMTGKRPSAD